MCNHCNNKKIKTNILKQDPSHTVTLRNKWINDMNKRFNIIKRLIYASVYTNDVFGLKPKDNPFKGLEALKYKGFQFETEAKKLSGFMDWLKTQVSRDVLELVDDTGSIITSKVPWTNTYVESAYKKGIRRAHTELGKAGYTTPPSDKYSFRSGLTTPVSVRKLELLYTRTFEELKGVTSTMSQQISRTLAQGLADGKGPMDIARTLNDRVDKIGITRARAIARTETMRAHHTANVETYRQAGVEGVSVLVEWSAGGVNVCPECAELDGKLFTLDEIEGLIPLHVNCKCVAVPRVQSPK